jgi:hypothetical protein
MSIDLAGKDDHVIGPRDSRSMLRLSDNFEVSRRVQVGNQVCCFFQVTMGPVRPF